MPTSLNFELHLGPGGSNAPTGPRGAAAPARLLLLGDFSGRGSGGATAAGQAQATGRWSAAAKRVDIDNLDAVLQHLAPKLHLQVQGQPCEFLPQSLDDFHPDQLLQSLPPLQQGLARLKALQDPARFAKAAAEWDGLRDGPDLTSPAHTAAAPTRAADDLLSSLLGGTVKKAAATAPAAPTAHTGIDALLHSAVAGHVVPAAPDRQPAYVAAAQAALADELRVVLHDPAFQALEGAWRGVQLLVSRLELGETLELHLVDATRANLLADLVRAQGRVEATALAGLFAGTQRDGGVTNPQAGLGGSHWHAAFGLYAFGAAAVDLGLLAALSTAAARAQTPFVAMAAADLVQAALEAGNGVAAEPSAWTTLRRSDVAPWLGLVASPLLLRLPYGRRQEPVQQLAFEELSGADEPGQLLWGSGAIAAAALLGRACGESDASAHAQTLEDLPALVLRDADDEAQLQACAGRYVSDADVDAWLTAGLMPLVSHRRKSAATLPRWQSVAQPLRALRGLRPA